MSGAVAAEGGGVSAGGRCADAALAAGSGSGAAATRCDSGAGTTAICPGGEPESGMISRVPAFSSYGGFSWLAATIAAVFTWWSRAMAFRVWPCWTVIWRASRWTGAGAGAAAAPIVGPPIM